MIGNLDPLSLTEDELERFYAERIAPILQAREEGRELAVRAYQGRLVLLVPTTILSASLVAMWYHEWRIGLLFGVITALSGRIAARAPLNAFATETKVPVLTAVAEASGGTYTPTAFEREGASRFEELKLLPYYSRSDYQDCFRGTYKGCAYTFYDAHLEERPRREWVTVFQGQLIAIAFPKKFLGTTVIRRDAGILNAVEHWKSTMQRVNLGDARLEKAFEVYATDQVEARELIHPVFMERLLVLEAALKGKSLRCAFVDGLLLVAVEGGDKFELGSMKTQLDDINRIRSVFADITEVMRLIDAVLTAEQFALPSP